jgi:hypothetical protein
MIKDMSMVEDDPVATALAILAETSAPPRLLRHGELVAEAARLLLDALTALDVAVDSRFVLSAAVLHDAGKTLHPTELDAPGNAHEEAGEALLLAHGVAPALARCCVSHARWRELPDCTFEELLVALADKLWKGVRAPDLEHRVLAEAASRAARDPWSLFTPLDTAFESIADAGEDRLTRARELQSPRARRRSR